MGAPTLGVTEGNGLMVGVTAGVVDVGLGGLVGAAVGRGGLVGATVGGGMVAVAAGGEVGDAVGRAVAFFFGLGVAVAVARGVAVGWPTSPRGLAPVTKKKAPAAMTAMASNARSAHNKGLVERDVVTVRGVAGAGPGIGTAPVAAGTAVYTAVCCGTMGERTVVPLGASPAPVARAAANSDASRYRSSGFLARARSTVAEACGVIDGLKSAGLGGTLWMCCMATPIAFSASNGRCPVSIS